MLWPQIYLWTDRLSVGDESDRSAPSTSISCIFHWIYSDRHKTLLWAGSQELITRKEELIAARASPPVYLKADLRELELSPSTFGTRFDVILIDPPWEEYVRRAPGVADTTGFWHPHEIANLKIEAIADTPSFVFLWVGNAEGLEWGRTCLKKVAPEVGWVTSKAH